MFRSVNASQASAVLNIGILVFREGLECVLVLAALTASLRGTVKKHRRDVAVGVGMASVATLITWSIAVRILDNLGQKLSALTIQAATGLFAIFVLLLVMNWFFHKLYWTGWISLHNQRKRDLLTEQNESKSSSLRIKVGMALPGFTCFYREGFEVVLFLQSYRLRLGDRTVLYGTVVGVLSSSMIAILTFVVHRHLPYRRMLVMTGVLLGIVLLVMMGEEAQEMQLARWLPTTEILRLERIIPGWMGLWFSVFPTVETLAAQAFAGLLVTGSYCVAQTSKQHA